MVYGHLMSTGYAASCVFNMQQLLAVEPVASGIAVLHVGASYPASLSPTRAHVNNFPTVTV